MCELKVCITCGIPKKLGQFYFRSDNGKRMNECKTCKVERSNNRQQSGPGPQMKKKKVGIKIKCNDCKREKDASYFTKRKGRPGYYRTCNRCKGNKNYKRRYETMYNDRDLTKWFPFV